jgi:serine phosphatase RsbU (regulator of sigma subunit)
MQVSSSPVSTKHRLAMRLQLRFGDTLLLFTDGLIERRGQPIDDALDSLLAIASQPAGRRHRQLRR